MASDTGPAARLQSAVGRLKNSFQETEHLFQKPQGKENEKQDQDAGGTG